ncbi:MAG: peptide-methionine (R)-S-oxide reductase MsrB [Anaerolineae bacterium]|nr:peptide-methionine (R)-S-oxide reductase MsrB [Anaerolineae bacterium]
MTRQWSRRSFMAMALGAAVGLAGCALAAPPAQRVSDEKYRATPLSLEEARGTTVERTEDEWEALLSPLQFAVMRQEGTERAFTGEYDGHKAEGTYHCSACGNPLFSSAAKFESGTGWPSYWEPIAEGVVIEEEDRSLGMVRTEVSCARCGSHLGHVFPDGPEPTGLRYCMNSIALNFQAVAEPESDVQGSLLVNSSREESLMTTTVGNATVFDFTAPETTGQWLIVNDGVMGGISQSEVALTGRQTMIFRGTLSLENYGGFASVRTVPRGYDLTGYAGFSLRVKGDGQRYKLRVRTENAFDGPAYERTFETIPNSWTTVTIAFHDMVPTFRGRSLTSFPSLDGDKIRQIGLMIADQQAGPFELEVDWIKAYRLGV